MGYQSLLHCTDDRPDIVALINAHSGCDNEFDILILISRDF